MPLSKIFISLAVFLSIAYLMYLFSVDADNIEEVNQLANIEEANNSKFRKTTIRKNIVAKVKNTAPTKKISVFINDTETKIIKNTVDIQLPELPQVEQLASIYQNLADNAENGDGSAAFTLANALKFCQTSFANKADLTNAIRDIKSGKPVLLPQRTQLQTIREINSNNVISKLQDDFHYCEGISSEIRMGTTKWLQIAVDSNTEGYAPLHMLIADTVEDPELNYRMAEKQWSEFGFSPALETLAIHHLQGTAVNESNQEIRDDGLAYAYFLAMSAIRLASTDRSNSLYYSQIETDLENVKMRLSSVLTVNQHLQAEIYAAELIRNNPLCCSSF